MNTYQSLTFRQIGDLLKALGNGAIGFDHKRYKLADLRTYIANCIAQGSYSAEHVEALAQQVAAPPALPQGIPMPAPALPPAPVALPLPPVALPLPPAPIAPAPDAIVPIPAPPAPVALPPAPQPVAPAVVIPQPVAPAEGYASARAVFGDVAGMSALFDARGDVRLRAYAHPDAPAINEQYQYDPENLHNVLVELAKENPMPVWLAGAAGTGKTDFVRQVAARLGRPLFRVSFNRATEPAEILGDMGLRDGATCWQDGPVTMGYRTPGAIILLDEVSFAAPGYLAALNPILESGGAALRLPRTGEQVTRAADVAFFGADNTLGHGDTTGRYPRNIMSEDFMSRFGCKLVFDFLPEAAEAKLLRQRVAIDCGKQLKAAAAAAIIKVARVARTKSDKGELQGAPGLRACIAMATLMAHGVPAERAYTVTVVRSAPPESHAELRDVFALNWPASDPDVAAFVTTTDKDA